MIVSQTLLPSLQEAITYTTDPAAPTGKQIKLGLTLPKIRWRNILKMNE